MGIIKLKAFMNGAFIDFTLFGRWGFDEVEVDDESLEGLIAVKGKYNQLIPHSSGRFQTKRFSKAKCPIVERLVNSLMMHGRNSGKKLLAINIVKHSFEIINLLTDKNPIQVLIDAVINSGPREDVARASSNARTKTA